MQTIVAALTVGLRKVARNDLTQRDYSGYSPETAARFQVMDAQQLDTNNQRDLRAAAHAQDTAYQSREFNDRMAYEAAQRRAARELAAGQREYERQQQYADAGMQAPAEAPTAPWKPLLIVSVRLRSSSVAACLDMS